MCIRDRAIHEHPELSFAEHETARYVSGQLAAEGISFRPIADVYKRQAYSIRRAGRAVYIPRQPSAGLRSGRGDG